MRKLIASGLAALMLGVGVAAVAGDSAEASAGDWRRAVCTQREYRALTPGTSANKAARILDGRGRLQQRIRGNGLVIQTREYGDPRYPARICDVSFARPASGGRWVAISKGRFDSFRGIAVGHVVNQRGNWRLNYIDRW